MDKLKIFYCRFDTGKSDAKRLQSKIDIWIGSMGDEFELIDYKPVLSDEDFILTIRYKDKSSEKNLLP